jgi:hypothetical protein
MKNEKTAQEIYDGHVARVVSESRLTLQRNTSAAGGVTALLVILALLQIGVADSLRQYAALAASIALPLFIAISAVYHAHIVAGKITYHHLSLTYVAVLVGLVQLSASLLLLAAIGLCVWSLSPNVGSIFGCATGVSGLIMIFFHASMLKYVKKETRKR